MKPAGLLLLALFAAPADAARVAPLGARAAVRPVISLPAAPALAPHLTSRLEPALGPLVPAAALATPQAVPAPAAAPALPAAWSALTELAAPAAAPADGEARADQVFDNAPAAAPLDLSAEPETVTRELASAPERQTLDLRFSRDAKAGLMADGLFATVRLLGGSGSRWYWGQFEPGVSVRVLSGGKTLFVSRVEAAATKPIGELVKKDLAGIYPPEVLRRRSIAKLRQQLIDEITAYNRYAKPGLPAVITLASEVRVVRFMPRGPALALPENRDEPVYEPVPRRPVDIPPALAEAHRFLPKAVLLDMRLFEKPVPAALVEDMGKLMKAGVYFILASDRRHDGPGSVEELLTKGLTNSQRDDMVRYKMIVVSDDGNGLAGFKGPFRSAMSMPRFSANDLELMALAARRLGAVSTQGHGDRFEASLRPGTDVEAFGRKLAASLRQLAPKSDEPRLLAGVDGQGRPALVLRPNDLASSLPHVLAALREEEGLFVDPSDLLVVSRDEALLRATAGSRQPARHSPAQGEELADLSLAALLGKYRENVPGDLAASASKIQSFLRNKDGGYGGGNVYMMMGHVMHSAFNWAIWTYRDTGVFPAAEELVAYGRRLWTREDKGRIKNMVEHPGETMDGYREVMESRLIGMREAVADLLRRYPIAVGTEIPNLFVIERFKKGRLESRDVLRMLFDLVLARQTPRGLELQVVDFKTGQTPTLQNLSKDVQVQLYDIAARSLWSELPLPFATGEMRRVADVGLTFIFPNGAYEPKLNEWDRIKYERFLRQVMNRIRKHNNPPPAKKKKTPAR